MIHDVLESWVKKVPDKILFYDRDQTLTYEEFYRYGKNLAIEFEEKGLKGKCVTLRLGNSVELAVGYLACFMSGAIAVPIDIQLKEREVDYIISETNPKFTLTHGSNVLIEGEKGEKLSDPSPQDPCAIYYTSGSTSRPKGVVHSGASFLAMLDTMADAADLTAEDRFLISEPMSNASGCNHTFLPLFAGGSGIIIPWFSPEEYVKIKKYKPTVLSIMGQGNSMIINDQNLNKNDFEGVRLNLSGGDKITKTLMEQFKNKTGAPIRYSYGMSEFLVLTVNKSKSFEKIGSVGTVAKNVKLELRDQKGKTADQGEMWASGPNCMIGYWNDEEETDKALVDGWLRTGDLLKCDAEGYYWFHGRLKLMIVRGGDNISPLEVEEVMGNHVAVQGVCVIGVDDPLEGQVPKAFVELKEGAHTTEEELLDFARKSLEENKVPIAVQFVDHLPRALNGKILRNQVK